MKASKIKSKLSLGPLGHCPSNDLYFGFFLLKYACQNYYLLFKCEQCLLLLFFSKRLPKVTTRLQFKKICLAVHKVKLEMFICVVRTDVVIQTLETSCCLQQHKIKDYFLVYITPYFSVPSDPHRHQRNFYILVFFIFCKHF